MYNARREGPASNSRTAFGHKNSELFPKTPLSRLTLGGALSTIINRLQTIEE